MDERNTKNNNETYTFFYRKGRYTSEEEAAKAFKMVMSISFKTILTLSRDITTS